MIIIFVATTTTIEESWNCEEKWNILWQCKKNCGKWWNFYNDNFYEMIPKQKQKKISEEEKGQCICLTD